MKRLLCVLLCLLLTGCAAGTPQEESGILLAATTAPVAQFTEAIVRDTGIRVQCVVSEAVSCLHDYSISTEQVKLLENADAVVISGLGLEHFMEDILPEGKPVLDASAGVQTADGDPHIWLDPARAAEMAENIESQLSLLYPELAGQFAANRLQLDERFAALQLYAEAELGNTAVSGLVTFHDGFGCLAEFLNIPLLAAMEVEAGSEPSARELEHIVTIVREHSLPAVFTEVNGADHTARVICQETGCRTFALDTAMGGTDYFTAMEYNIDTIREAFS